MIRAGSSNLLSKDASRSQGTCGTGMNKFIFTINKSFIYLSYPLYIFIVLFGFRIMILNYKDMHCCYHRSDGFYLFSFLFSSKFKIRYNIR